MIDGDSSNTTLYESSKRNIFAIQRELMRSKVQLPLALMLIIALIEFYLSSSIFFVQSHFEPQIASKVLRYPLLTDFQLQFALSRNLVITLLLVCEVLLLILYAIIWIKSSQHESLKLVSKIANGFFSFYRMNLPMIMFFVVETNKRVFFEVGSTSFVSKWTQNEVTDHGIKYNITTIIILVILNMLNFLLFTLSLHVTYLNIYPLRKGNKSWNFNNRFEFFIYLSSILRALVISIDGSSVAFIIVSFAAQLMIFKHSIQQKPFTQEASILHNFKNNLGLALHMSLVFSVVTKNRLLAFQVFVLFLMLVFIKIVINYVHYNRRHLSYPLCDSKMYQFYDFYFLFSQLSEKGFDQNLVSFYRNEKSGMRQIFQIHEANCKAKTCIFKTCKRQKLNDLEYCQKLTDKIMETRKYESPENYIMSELWKLQSQTKNKIQIFNYVKENTLETEFIFQSVSQLLRDIQSKNEINFKNHILKTKKFYDNLDSTMNSFSRFYAEVGKSLPEFEIIVQEGYECRQKATKLKSLYNEILKSKCMNFKMLEVYLEFQVRFGSHSDMSQNLIQKAAQFQKNQIENVLEEVYLPTMHVNQQTGIIENFNMEASNFLKFTKFELKLKPLSDIFMPIIDSREFNSCLEKSNEVEKIKAILKKGNKECICVKLQIMNRTIENRKLWVINFEEEKLFQNKNVYLVNQEFDIVVSIRKQTHFKTTLKNKHSQGFSLPIPIQWQKIFQEYIKPQREELIESRILKLRVPQLQNLLMIINLESTTSSMHQLVKVTVVVDLSQNKSNRLSSRNSSISKSLSVQNSSVFKFYYTEEEDSKQDELYEENESESNSYEQNSHYFSDNNLLLSLVKQSNEKKQYHLKIFGERINLRKPQSSVYYSPTRYLQSEFLVKNLNNLIVKKTIINQQNLKSGIKTYRLWQKELYNIELEDRQAYVNSLDTQPALMAQSDSSVSKTGQLLTFYMFVLVLLLVVILSGSVYTMINNSITNFDTIQVSFKKEFLMQSILLSYNKINAILRDVKNGLYDQLDENWQDDLVTSLSNIRIKRIGALDLFRSLDYELSYNNITYQGNFNQLLDVYQSEVSSLVREGKNIAKINDIHMLAFNYIDKFFKQQRQYHFDVLFEKAADIGQNLSYVLYVCLGLIFFIKLAIIKMLHTIFSKLKERLNFVLLTSDYQAKVKYENSQKLRYTIQMIQKNFDIDLKNFLINRNHFHKRKKPKDVKYNNNRKYGRIFFIVMYFLFHLSMISTSSMTASDNIHKIEKMFDLGRSVMRSYTEIVHVSTVANVTGDFDKTEVEQAKESLYELESNRQASPFGPRVDQLIQLFMYENVCDDPFWGVYLFVGEKTTCDKALPGFQIENPFSLGCINYIRRLHYSLVDNITQTLGATGLYSTSFARLYNRLSEAMLAQGQMRIEEYTKQLSSSNQLLVFLSFLYVLYCGFLIWNERSNIQKIKEIIEFFKSGQEKRLFRDNRLPSIEKKQTKVVRKRENRTSINSLTVAETQMIESQLGKKRTIELPIKENNSFMIVESSDSRDHLKQTHESPNNKMMPKKRRMSRFAGGGSVQKPSKFS